ncbi:hypothetical protein CMV_026446 [Castanea mollissima]|uniref:Uncharacterized protein n=1 Tax=Castanea mollissima TaxID=60419 RepID=A0A8J4QCZ8_9ROSI|nr:hypothetical protein CMV_026446 [Castanea mollissima]
MKTRVDPKFNKIEPTLKVKHITEAQPAILRFLWSESIKGEAVACGKSICILACSPLSNGVIDMISFHKGE